MRVYDVVHGYQPFTNELMSDWVGGNLDRVFLPTSKAMASGLVRHNIQLQGWTIDAWLAAPNPISQKAKRVLSNLRLAARRDNVEVGFSAYSHCLLPLVGDELAYAQMRADYETVREHLVEPSFFWFPECAVNPAKLGVLYRRFPGVIAVIPDGAVGGSGSRFATVRGADYRGRAAVANTLVKDVLMNSVVYDKPGYVPASLDWLRSHRSMRDADEYRHVLGVLDGRREHVVVRDWENGESRDALRNSGGMADVAAMLDSKGVEFALLSERPRFDVKFYSKDLQPSCWEPLAKNSDPFPYWTPAGACGWKAGVCSYWLRILGLYEAAFRAAVVSEAGTYGVDAVDAAFRNRRFFSLFKSTSPALLSCLPWHLLARDEWEKFPDFPKKLLERVVLPAITEMSDYAGQKQVKRDVKGVVKGFIRAIDIK